MLTGVLPYETPTPSDLEKLRRGELVRPPRLLNNAIPSTFNDVVMKALAPEVTDRYSAPLRYCRPWTRSGRGGVSRRPQPPLSLTPAPRAASRVRRCATSVPVCGHRRRSRRVLLALPKTSSRQGRPVPLLRRSTIAARRELCCTAAELNTTLS